MSGQDGGQQANWESSPEETSAIDAERQAIADRLRRAAASGLLPFDVFEQRIDAAYSAETLGELEKLANGLPAPKEPSPGSEPAGGRRFVPVLAGVALLALVLIVADVAAAGWGTRGRAPAAASATKTGSTASGSGSSGFVQPQKGAAGKFCKSMAANHAQDPASNPSGITPGSNFWGANKPVKRTADVVAVTTATAATFLVMQAWQANGYQYTGLTISCLNDYDPAFQFVGSSSASTGGVTVSTSFRSEHSLLAVRTSAGRCWYALNVMNASDPIIEVDDLQSYGAFYATSPGGPCTASRAPGFGLWQSADPLPPQLGSGGTVR
jgi:hypothetical protein